MQSHHNGKGTMWLSRTLIVLVVSWQDMKRDALHWLQYSGNAYTVVKVKGTTLASVAIAKRSSLCK